MSPRKAVDEELGRDKIMQAARELFAEQGYRSVSMRGIAGKLGYSHGALYYHFKDKADLFSAMVIADFERLDERLEDVAAGRSDDPKETLERLFLAYIRFGFEHKRHYEVMFLLAESELNDAARTAKMRSYEKFAAFVTELLKELGSAESGTLMAPWSLFLSLHGFVAYYLHTDQTYDGMRGLAEKHARLLVRGTL
ncbi:TetR/AcrR family transcriptional regulator [Paenibacillus flagellatus]|uniref:TetR/AcrR family transcriptional regulator n=1 Tax=Paenibacillus flagellatus TaxID=2211139 RepID=A0A2V5K1K4_9BACL|nr:TetR/AcrR family transcriptional regulator [Paenibacillus flagellatus]PYI52981.1 TetR/AcrR family transcriptional regulator [Paenibacillus flagellatus]